MPLPAHTRDALWYTPHTSAVRIETREEGLYQIPVQRLLDLGVPPADLGTDRMRLVRDGRSIPCIVRDGGDGILNPEDRLVFFAPRVWGENGARFNEWSDANVTWLLFDGQPLLGYDTLRMEPHGEPERLSFPDTLHLEEDAYYHAGDNDYESGISETVDGEGWIWTYLRTYDSLGVKKKDSVRVPFNVHVVQDRPTFLRFRIRGSSRDSSRVQFLINDVLVQDRIVGGKETVLTSIELPDGLLRSGSNVLTIRSIGAMDCPPGSPDCPIERVYVDWCEILHASDVHMRDNLLDVHPDSSLGEERRRLRITGLTDSAVVVIDLTQAALGMGGTWNAGVLDLAAPATHRLMIATEASLPVPDVRRTTLPEHATGTAPDYLVITHSVFRVAAEQLAQWRESQNGWTVRVVDIEDLYTTYGYGRKTPEVIRSFLKEIRSATQPAYLVLMGDASWDPKKLRGNSTKTDFLPTIGNPANDNAFVALDDGTARPSLSVGRIPAETAAEAMAYVEKLRSYELESPRPWNRTVLFAVGGKTSYERDQLFLPQARFLVQKYLEPACLDPHMIVKKKLDIVSYDDLDTLITEMNRGVLWFNFTGHGGTRIIDMGVERPDIFATRNRYPFFVTLSCNTAHFAEPYETGLNERFAMAVGNGSIVSFGTSGLGVVSYDDMLSRYMFSGLTEQRLSTWGELTTIAKQRLLQNSGSGNQLAINTVNQYVILGDPAARIPLVRGSELLVEPEDLSVSTTPLFENQPFVLTTTLHSAGTCLTDSIDIRLRLSVNGTALPEQNQRIPAFTGATTISWPATVRGMSGPMTARVEIDPLQRLSEYTTTNNSAEREFTLLPRGAAALLPYDHSVLTASPTFLIANPSVLPQGRASTGSVVVQWGRDPEFRTGVSESTGTLGLLVSRAESEIPMDTGVVYWRARVVSGSMTTEWTATRCFRFGTIPAEERWEQQGSVPLSRSRLVGLEERSDGTVVPGTRPFPVEVVSAGNNQVEIQDFAEIRLDGTNVSVNRRGFNVVTFDPRTGRVRDTLSFDTYADRAQAGALAAFLRTLDPALMVACAIRDDANGHPDFTIGRSNITPELREAFALFGSRFIDSVGFRDSWAFLGTRSDPRRAREDHRRYGAAFFKDTLIARASSGRIESALIGPASSWMSAQWEGTRIDGGRGSLQVWGTGDSLVLERLSWEPGEVLSLATIDASRHPRLRLSLTLTDTSFTDNIALKSWRCDFARRVPEVGITNQVLSFDQDSVEQGQHALLRVTPVNAGSAGARVPLHVRMIRAGQALIDTLTALDLPPTLSPGQDLLLALPTAQGAGEWMVECRIGEPPFLTELYDGNNRFSLPLRVGRDFERPDLLVWIDGQPIADDDPVSPTPVIKVRLRDDSPLPITDTAAVQLVLDGRRVPITGNPELAWTGGGTGEDKLTILFRPRLSSGYHVLSVTAKDASGNPADTIPYQVRFRVDLDGRAEQVLPFPNPASGPMDLTFFLTGSIVPSSAHLKFYTMVGRCIRDLDLSNQLRIGFNRIPWDLRDQDGDRVANGLYFYRLILTREADTEEHRGPLTIAR